MNRCLASLPLVASIIFGLSIADASAKPARQRSFAPAMVAVTFDADPGTILIRTRERKLYYMLGNGRAIRYPVAVGMVGKQWSGWSIIDGIHVEPAWSPTPEMKRDNPRLPNVIPGGAPNNPMGVLALTLTGGEYAIHGTNRPDSIGRFASYGCIRMYNSHVLDLSDRVSVGTPVVVVP